MIEKLDARARAALGTVLPKWTNTGARDAIRREFRFGGFSEAFAFMTRVALLAEKQDHHPEWSNVWNRVEIMLSTHDAGGVSARDVTMAQMIDVIFDNAHGAG